MLSLHKRALCMLLSIAALQAQQESADNAGEQSIKIGGTTSAAVVAKIYAVNCDTPHFMTLLQQIAMHLSATKQFAVSIVRGDAVSTKQEFAAISGSSTAIVLYCVGSEGSLQWRLLDGSGGESLLGKKSLQGDRPLWLWAADIADQLWQAMTSMPGDFTSVLIACKKEKKKLHGRQHRTLAVIHPTFGSQWEHAKVLVNTLSDNFAPRVHPVLPFVYYSQHTPTNVRLMVVDTDKRTRVVTNFDGQNLTPALNAQGKIVLCLSQGESTHLYEYRFCVPTGKGEFIQLTHGKGQYLSPTFANEHTIACAYIDESLVSTLQLIDLTTRAVTKLPVGRAYCPAGDGKGHIVFCKRGNGRLQLWLYDIASGQERQLTHTSSDKDEPSWSPSGNYIAATCIEGTQSRIAIVDATSGKQRYITPSNEQWSGPCWAGREYTMAVYRRQE